MPSRIPSRLAVVLISLICALALDGQAPEPGKPPLPEEKPVAGIPVTDPLIVSRCGTCHKQDEKGNLTRISWERTSPEGWEEVIKRMVRLNGLALKPEEARAIVKSLSASHGLAPEEASRVAYMSEHRIIDEAFPNDNIRTTCAACHPFGRVASFRRSAEEWKLLADLHVALYPVVELTAFLRRGPGRGPASAPASAPGPPPPQPVDQAIDYLTKNFPLETPEWAAWRTRARAPRLAGKWLASAHIAGHGDFTGEVAINPASAADEFTTRIKLVPMAGGPAIEPAIERSGKIQIFNGYAWRGRSTGTASGTAPGDIPAEMRESMLVAADQSQATGRWFWGGYDEFGMDVKLVRVSGAATIVAVDRPSLKAGSQAERVRIRGGNFPVQLAATDVDFGAGVAVRRIVSHTAEEVVVEVDVAAKAVSGRRDIAIGGAVLPNAIAVYDKVDYIKVLPGTSIARLGGASKKPKGYQQFEVMAYNRGADDKPNTPDDVEVGPLDVTWSVEEFFEVFGDDDKDFGGTLSQTGLFTPALDGPNPERRHSRNNFGTVWVVATAKNEKDKFGHLLTGRSYLVVSPPLYVVWDKEIVP